MSKALFVSDIHIASPRDEKYRLFLRWLDHCRRQPPQYLFLVGDIFDLWVADRRFFTDRYAEAAARLRELVAMGVQIHYFEGNHDLDLRRYWQEKVGVEVHEEAAYFEINGRRVRVEHGDQMDPEDRGYLFLRWLLRTPVVRFLGRHLPDVLVSWVGQWASRTSRDYTSTVKTSSEERSRQVLHIHAQKVWLQQPFDLLVCGHVHVHEDARLASGAAVYNLGTWLKDPLVLVVDETGVRLRPVAEFLTAPGPGNSPTIG